MKNNNKYTILTVFLLIFIATLVNVNAQPSFVQESGDLTDVLEISVPKPLVFELNSNITSGHFHVFNSTGVLLKPVLEANCTIHIYDNLNKHLLEQNLTADSNGVDFKVTLNQSYFSQSGEFGFIIWCYSPDESGFYSSSFFVTNSGSVYEDHSGLLAMVILTVGMTGLLFMFGNMLDNKNDWSQALKLFCNIIALFILLAGSGFTLRALYLFDYPSSLINIAGVIYFTMLFTVTPILIILLWMFMKNLMEFYQELTKGDKFG